MCDIFYAHWQACAAVLVYERLDLAFSFVGHEL
jgi:hypothetical protein